MMMEKKNEGGEFQEGESDLQDVVEGYEGGKVKVERIKTDIGRGRRNGARE